MDNSEWRGSDGHGGGTCSTYIPLTCLISSHFRTGWQ